MSFSTQRGAAMDKKQGGQQAEEQADEVFPVDEGGPVEKVEKPKLVTSIASTVDEGGDEAARSIGKPKELEERGAGRILPLVEGQRPGWISRMHEAALAPRWKSVFLHMRWGVLAWLAADLWWHWQLGAVSMLWALGLGLAYLATQAFLASMPVAAFDELWPATAIFLFDLTYLLGSLWRTGQADGPLVLACSLAVFVAALTHKVLKSFLGALVAAGVWLGLQLYTPQGFDFVKPEQVLVLPLIFLLALLMGAVSEMAQDEIIQRRALEAGQDILTGKLKSHAQELAVAYQFGTGLLDAIPLAVMVIDEGGIIRFLNHEAESILGIKRRKVLDKPLASELLLVPFKEAMAAARRRVVHLEALSFLNSSGEGFCMGFRAVPVKGGLDNPLGSLGMLLPGDFKGQGLDAVNEQATDHHWARDVSPEQASPGGSPQPLPKG
jgi:PAS domain S-box-containing protein